MFCIWGFLNTKRNKSIFHPIVSKNIFLNNFKLLYLSMFTMGYMTILLEIVQISGFEVFFVIKTKRFITLYHNDKYLLGKML